MPELPEVETIKKDLEKKILLKKIIKIEVLKPNLVKNKLNYFLKTVKNNTFLRMKRIGKLMILELKDHKYLLIHLRMTGQLVYKDKQKIIVGGHNYPQIDNLPNKYSHLTFTFQDKSQLFFNDLRQFGYLKIVSQEEKDKVIKGYGLDLLAHTFTLNNFLNLFKERRSILKGVLLNQKIIAGIGNIYADEALWGAHIHPQRLVASLSEDDFERIYIDVRAVMNLSIEKGGSSNKNYVNAEGKKGSYMDFARVFRREGLACPRCGATIEKLRVAGRGTHICPVCQTI